MSFSSASRFSYWMEVDDGLQFLNVAVTRQLGSLLKFTLWLAVLEMALLLRITWGLMMNAAALLDMVVR
jgi:hypothetical protein